MNVFRNLIAVVGLAGVAGCATAPPDAPPPEPLACPEPVECPVCDAVPEPAACPPPEVIEKIVRVPAPAPAPTSTGDEMDLPIIGAVEMALVEPAGLLLEARIDSGAETTSIHAEDIQLVEKEGKRYVRFNLLDDKGAKVPQELRLKRRVLIKQQDSEDLERRYVVRMWVTIGDIRTRIGVNLSDREDFEFPLLIGRNFLLDAAVVDVSRNHTQPTPKPAPETAAN
ncbi:hypothetical protein E4634_09960 [Mangrovimicrobium sediminis]|uniref:Retropepsin-like aspartic endopeptidase domain-containing protein n=1 Tax=Mangrovimicrobium sediminis TaxID=2562682 RepID=A0A4Z0M1J6_9GAMM|nr:RimK/LysX family protein [Haliea sp. SAOS-164]TGD73350.1 hypothetical protein E4634_09960 [Haliea sp. SAOS-164]